MRSFILTICLVLSTFASAGNPSKWAQSSPERQKWFEDARRPGSDPKGDWHEIQSCCAEDTDAYETDLFETEDGELYAIITEGNDGIQTGSRVHIPKDKIITDLNFLRRNPTGHGWVWMIGHTVFCYVLPSGG
jgi:hypothetical protein